ncbi:hypothetical protein [Streptomyces sp. NPDC005533]|uniref:hypothetical protein n=1 Tax=Streptomyces sp. NPDC005533 TaxID=3364723 RepID=UPI0036B403F8
MTPTATTPDQPRSGSSARLSRRPHRAHAVASEWIKLVSIRSTLWTLGSFVLAVVGIGLLFVAQSSDEGYTMISFTMPALFGLIAGQVAVTVLGVLAITSEHGTGLARTTFTAAPDRYRVLTPSTSSSASQPSLPRRCPSSWWGPPPCSFTSGAAAGPHAAHEWLGVLLGCLYLTLLGALAIGALLRHSAGAIAVTPASSRCRR